MQDFLVFQSLWAMEGLQSSVASSSLEETVRSVAEANFDGLSACWTSRESIQSIWHATQGASLRIEGICFPKSVDDLKRTLDLVAEYPVMHLNIHADMRARTLEACAPILEGWFRLIEQVDTPIYFETHRGRLTNDLLFTLELLKRYPQIKLLADLSHYVVAREFVYPITEESDEAIHEVLEGVWAFHGRVGSNEQIQLEISVPNHRQWVEQFCKWWLFGFRNWRHRAPQDAALVFTCELGPQPYAIAGLDGRDRSDRWLEALQLRDLAREIWQAAAMHER